jgi:tetratricopeptide (TPR) repeat protein
MRILPPFLLALLAFLPTPVSATPDRIERRSGPAIVGVTVTEENYEFVRYKDENGRTRKISAGEVAEVIRDGYPAGLREGRSLIARGKAVNAMEVLALFASQSAQAEGDAEWQREYAHFYLGQAALRAKKWDDARTAFAKVLEVNDKSRFFVEAHGGIVSAHLGAGRAAEATRAASALEKAAEASDLPTIDKLRAVGVHARALAQTGRHRDAERLFDRIAKQAGEERGKADIGLKSQFQELRVLSLWGQGQALVGNKDYTTAERVFTSLDEMGTLRARSLSRIGEGMVALRREEFAKAHQLLVRAIATEAGAEKEVAWAYLRLAETCVEWGKNLSGKARLRAQAEAKHYLAELSRLYADSDAAREGATLEKRL